MGRGSFAMVAVALGAVAAACADGDPELFPVGDDGVEPPAVVAASPDDGACVEVDLLDSLVPQVEFSRPMYPGTINVSTFVVTRNGVPVAGTVEYQQSTRTARFIPLLPLTAFGRYDVTITTDAADTGGRPLAAEYRWSFGTAIGTARTYSADVAIGGGTAFAVWQQHNDGGGDSAIFGAWHTTDAGWGDAQRIARGSYPHVAIDPRGNTFVMWSSVGNGATYARRHDAVIGWGLPAVIGPPRWQGPMVELDSDGNALVLGTESQSGRLWTNRYRVGEGWATADVLPPISGADWLHVLALEGDAAGNAIAVVAAAQHVWSLRYEPGSGWSSPTALDAFGEPAEASVGAVLLDVEPEGAATALLVGSAVWERRFDPSVGWGPGVLRSDPDVPLLGVRMARDHQQRLLVAWTEARGAGDYRLEAVRYSPGSAWPASETLAVSSDDITTMFLGGDREGNAVLVWSTWLQPHRINSRTYVPWVGWGEPQGVVAPVPSYSAYAVDVRFDDDANAVGLWYWGDGSPEVWVLTLDGIAALPSVERVSNNEACPQL